MSCFAQQVASPQVVSITLSDAIKRAQSANTAYAAATSDAAVGQSERTIARSALLPGIVYHNEYLYTQGAGGALTPIRFIANNAVHEYISQGSITETIGGAGLAGYTRAKAEAAATRARLEVARRGLVVIVVGNYYDVLATEAKFAVAQRALGEASRFSTLTRQREAGGDVAHADSVRADLQFQQRQRELNDAKVSADRARLDLGVLLFSDPTTPYKLTTSLDQLPNLPSRSEVEAAAMLHNPDLKAAMESLRAARFGVTAARFAYFPDLSLNYSYGIDAAQFAVRAPGGVRNLGYSAAVTFDIPMWDWFATQSRVHESVVRREQAKVELTVTQRKLIASLNELYQEAQVSLDQLQLLDKSVQSATESLRLTTLRYSSGEGNVLEVVDSENALVQAESSHADGAARYFNALANLQTLTGSMP
ncbi:MAG TPA: TolC family protein [Terracidiphilus sp.]|nr:TolC family protein [Terracidiphilus sp.]